jgi:transcriptional regulator with XRE-family HTH domain
MPGHIIKHYREVKNYSQKYVASRLGISQNAYSKIENNITQLTVHHIKELSKILDVPITDFLKDDFEIHKPMVIPRVVTKTDLLEKLEMIKRKLEAKHATKNENYVVMMSLIVAADHSLSQIH